VTEFWDGYVSRLLTNTFREIVAAAPQLRLAQNQQALVPARFDLIELNGNDLGAFVARLPW
jgi:hypothetical protein